MKPLLSHNQTAIELEGVSKMYTIHHEKPTLVEHLIKGKSEEFYALHDIHLTIKKGERVGIIGPNGSGKTTLLKIIAGITSPTNGMVTANGAIVSLIDLEAGFHPDLTGIENVYLNGMLLGMKKQEIKRTLRSIIAFADIQQFIDVPLFTYSEGMKLRLGFAVAVHANPDILILDEGLSVGDRDFQKKSQVKIQEFFRKGKTILVVTHWLDFVRRNCNRIVILRKGSVAADGPISLMNQYERG
jgi:ABC-type polysaccharide/polyol phosphate transport system ATPase subunit